MAEDLIRYDIVIQDALRGAVRKILTEVVRIGLPGEHHFYIAFDTNAPGVRISPRLHERYPNEMTVVLQHQFWDLTVTDHAFEVGLSFGGIPEKLFVPFSSIKGFFDPSVQFALEFEPGKTAEELPEELVDAARDQERAEATLADIDDTLSRDRGATAKTAADKPKSKKTAGNATDKTGDKAGEKTGDDDTASADVVSLDAFRKKP
ncbi:ClpXP protease specificity-enhancing factor SspB [Stappia stellulata]|uniref:SspB family protein n=1 Tax=Stappia stellulata TaxID=71235 RepID=UPI001CD1D120|nr:ClpXP protease specificity-enhancing factor SspB [Stappia stellulata]MCA1242456.1 ClpXP protease specificity-enhancing factor SspB [Stappia stellulata]